MIRLKDLKSINVPRKEDYKIDVEYAKAIERRPELKKYFAHYDEHDFKPQRTYFWEVYNTLDPKYVSSLIDEIQH